MVTRHATAVVLAEVPAHAAKRPPHHNFTSLIQTTRLTALIGSALIAASPAAVSIYT